MHTMEQFQSNEGMLLFIHADFIAIFALSPNYAICKTNKTNKIVFKNWFS